jgi:hypothetical protein
MSVRSVPIAAVLLILVGGCASQGSASQSAQPTQWKEVTRMVNGTYVTYRVPVNRTVPGAARVRPIDFAVAGGSTSVPEQAAPSPQSKSGQAVVGWGAPISAAPAAPSMPSKQFSSEAKVAYERAADSFRDLQARYDAARTAMRLAGSAAERGDSASVIKYSKAAMNLSCSKE